MRIKPSVPSTDHRPLEQPPHSQPEQPRIHHFQRVIEAGVAGRGHVILTPEHGRSVGQVEYVGRQRQVARADPERLLDAQIQCGHSRQPLVSWIDQQHALLGQRRIGGFDRLEVRLAIALARQQAGREVDAPWHLVHPDAANW